MPQIELVAASDDVPFSVHLDRVASKTDPQQLHLKLGTSSKLVLDVVPESIVVPDGLLDAAQTRLLSFSELRSQAIDKVAELEQSWHRIVDQCANFTVTLKTSAGGAVLLNGGACQDFCVRGIA